MRISRSAGVACFLLVGLPIAAVAAEPAATPRQPTAKDKQVQTVQPPFPVGSDAAVRYARAVVGVARFTWQKNLEANQRIKGRIATIDVKRLELEFRKAELALQKAELEQSIAGVNNEIEAVQIEKQRAIEQAR